MQVEMILTAFDVGRRGIYTRVISVDRKGNYRSSKGKMLSTEEDTAENSLY